MAYTDDDKVLALLGKPDVTADQIKAEWHEWVDALIEQWTGFGFRGATRTHTEYGSGTSLVRLPSKAQSVTEVTEDDVALPAADYRHVAGSRFVERKGSSENFWMSPRGRWIKGLNYVFTYVEPSTVPKTYEVVATQAIVTIFLFMEKYGEVGLILSTSESGSISGIRGLAGAESQSYPASMIEEVQRIIRQGLRKTGV